ncbi:hypothetical protein [Glutamicibacter soli]|uniref:hypothetical protein n=1 Tax=Glutamicibacter soli TaxID=453836 RepID=UPI003FD50F31
MSKSNRFDPEAGKDYGRCRDCDLTLETREDAESHMHSSMQDDGRGGRASHSVSVLNPPRQARIDSEVRWAVSGALDDAVAQLERLLRDASEDEISSALSGYPDFRDAWEGFCDER